MSNNQYKILVTGVAGFLGSHLSEQLSGLGHKVIGIDNMIGGYKDNIPKGVEFHNIDCCDFEKIKGIMKGVQIVYHCAATAHEGLSVFSPYEITKNNYLASVSIFSAAVNEKVKRIIFCSSMARYGSQEYPFTETMKPKPVDPYAISKVAAEQVLINLCELNKIEWVIAVPHNIIGPRQKYDDPFRNVVSIMINRMLQGKAPIIYGDGKQTRSFCYVDDLIIAFQLLMDSDDGFTGPVNLGNPCELTILELADEIIKLNGSNSKVVFKPFPNDDPKQRKPDINLAKKRLRWEPKIEIRIGLEKTIRYFEEIVGH